MTRPRRVLLALDLGGVLYDIELRRFQQRMLQTFSVQADALGEATFSSGIWQRADRGELDAQSFASEVLMRLGVEVNARTRDQFSQAWCSVLELRSGVAELLRALHIATVAWSNTDPVHALALRAEPALSPLRDWILSCELGAEKPCPHFFQQALSRQACSPAAVVYADDRRCNVAAARALGIDAFVVDSLAALRTGLRQRGLLSVGEPASG